MPLACQGGQKSNQTDYYLAKTFLPFFRHSLYSANCLFFRQNIFNLKQSYMPIIPLISRALRAPLEKFPSVPVLCFDLFPRFSSKFQCFGSFCCCCSRHLIHLHFTFLQSNIYKNMTQISIYGTLVFNISLVEAFSHIYINVYMCIYVDVYICMCVCIVCIYMYIVYMCIYTCIVYTCVCAYVYVCFVYMHICVRVYNMIDTCNIFKQSKFYISSLPSLFHLCGPYHLLVSSHTNSFPLHAPCVL